MTDRTDLFKALNHFMVMLNVHVPSGEADVEMVVGDTAFRALSDAMDAAPHMAAKFYGDTFVLKVPSGRVVIRKRQPSLADLAAEAKALDELKAAAAARETCWVCGKPAIAAMRLETKDGTVSVHHFCSEAGVVRARHESREAQLEREKADTYENISTPPGTMPKQEPLKCAWCRRNPSIASFSRAGTASPICAECVWPASRGKPVLGNPPAWLDEPDDYVPQLTRPEAEKAMADLSGINSVVRGEPGACRDGGGAFCPPEETKPPARAHLKAPASDHAPDCRMPHASAESCTEANVPSRALSPRQALGEALACVERARDLLRTAATSQSTTQSGFEARVASFRAYDDMQRAWGSITTARAYLVDGE